MVWYTLNAFYQLINLKKRNKNTVHVVDINKLNETNGKQMGGGGLRGGAGETLP